MQYSCPCTILIELNQEKSETNSRRNLKEKKMKVAQLCPTLSFSRGYSQPRDGTQVSHIAGGFFTI